MTQQSLFEVSAAAVVRADSSMFAGWIRRPDYRGRMGWEAPGLTEWERWWARCSFDDLPDIQEEEAILHKMVDDCAELANRDDGPNNEVFATNCCEQAIKPVL